MYGINPIDGSRKIDWGHTSADYSQWRPDYPAEFYDRLSDIEIGIPGQTILDLGTGVGFLARNFAARGAAVTGIDIAENQIDEARRCAETEGLEIDFRVAPAEQTSLPDNEFDVVTGSQCWLYFDRAAAGDEVRRLLRPGGRLMLSHFCWLPREDPIAQASEQLVLEHNPDWSAADWDGVIPSTLPEWAEGRFDLVDQFVFTARIPFTHERWRGRFRACRGVGASLSPEEIERFDQAHQELLERTVEPEFTVLHQIDATVFRPVDH